MQITIKTKYNQYGSQYWFAENKYREVFHLTYGESYFEFEIESTLDSDDYKNFKNCITTSIVNDWSFKSLDELKNALKKHFQKNPQNVETLNF